MCALKADGAKLQPILLRLGVMIFSPSHRVLNCLSVIKPLCQSGNAAEEVYKCRRHRIRETLLAARADGNAQDRNADAALEYAIMDDHLNAVEVLLDQAANVRIQDTDGDMALHYAVMVNAQRSNNPGSRMIRIGTLRTMTVTGHSNAAVKDGNLKIEQILVGFSEIPTPEANRDIPLWTMHRKAWVDNFERSSWRDNGACLRPG